MRDNGQILICEILLGRCAPSQRVIVRRKVIIMPIEYLFCVDLMQSWTSPSLGCGELALSPWNTVKQDECEGIWRHQQQQVSSDVKWINRVQKPEKCSCWKGWGIKRWSGHQMKRPRNHLPHLLIFILSYRVKKLGLFLIFSPTSSSQGEASFLSSFWSCFIHFLFYNWM